MSNSNWTADLICRLIAIASIVTIEIVALSKGVNGIALSVSVGAIAGILGVKIGQATEHKRMEKEKEKQ